MEFLLFGSVVEMELSLVSENLSRVILLRIVLFFESLGLKDVFFVVKYIEEGRWLFIYDLMEFLFLLCLGGSFCFDLG